MKQLILFLLLFVISCQQKKNITLLPQWHLAPNQIILSKDDALKLEQYPNQQALYLILSEWIENNQVDLLLAEGCEESEIDANFSERFNGLTVIELSKLDGESLDHSMAPVPMKIEAKFGEKIKTFCGDSLRIINEHSLIFSELRGYAGFLTRLSDPTTAKYSLFLKSLEELAGQKIEKPIPFLKEKMKELLKKERELLSQRNQLIVDRLISFSEKNIVLVIGHRHVEELLKLLSEAGHQVSVPEILSQTLPQVDESKLWERLISGPNS